MPITSEACNENPLTPEIFRSIDSDPNGRLTIDDFKEDAELLDFILRLIQTNSRSTYLYYVNLMNTGLKNLVAVELKKILADPNSCLSLEQKNRIENWLANELDTDRLAAGGVLSYDYNQENAYEGIDLVDEHYYRQDIYSNYSNKEAGLTSWLSFRKPLGTSPWLISTVASATIKQQWSSESGEIKIEDTVLNENTETPYELKESPLYLKGWGKLELSHMYDKVQWHLQGTAKSYTNPLADKEKNSYWIYSFLRSDNLIPQFNSTASFEYSQKYYTLSILDTAQQREQKYWRTSAEFSYHPSAKLAIYSTQIFTKNEQAQLYSDDLTQKYEGLLLPHLSGEKTFLRFGAGGNYQTFTSQQIDRQQTTDTQSAGAILYSRGQYQPSRTITLETQIKGSYNYIEGTFQGWYPQLNTYSFVQFSGNQFKTKLNYDNSYFERNVYFTPSEDDLDEEGNVQQAQQYHRANLEIKYFPRDYIEGVLSSSVSKSSNPEYSFRRNEGLGYSFFGQFVLGLPKNPAINIKVYGKYSYNETLPYYFPSSEVEKQNIQAGIALTADNIILKK